jgi:hypothetical protein
MTAEGYRGASAADIWSDTSWLDLDALYLEPKDIAAKANAAYLAARYPVLMFEDWYEGEHSMTEFSVRQEGYSAVLGGCTLGRFFGNYAIWDFDWKAATSNPWKNELGASGSVSQSWLGRLFRSREHWKLVPDIDHKAMTAGYDPRPSWRIAKESIRSAIYRLPFRMDEMSSVAARTSDGQTIVAYVPNGNAATITIAMSGIKDAGMNARCWWFNPRDGSSRAIGTVAARGERKFTPPDGQDWVLVIDSEGANLPAPGTADL